MTRDTAFRRAAWASSSADYNCTAHLVTERFGEWRSAESDGAAPEWLRVDLGADTDISRINIHWGEPRATDYAALASSDGERWTAVREADTNARARYVRLLLRRSAGSGYAIRRLEVIGENALRYETPGGWFIERAEGVNAGGEDISRAEYDASDWLPATVPGTALVSYLKAGAIPDPNYDDWQFQVSEAFFTADFWYRARLAIPDERRGQRVFLNFDAINWKADVYFNGKLLPNALAHRKHSIEGAFIRASFDVTELARFGEENAVAVLVYKNDTPGEVTTQGLAEGPGPNGGLLGADNPTLHASVGWDWLPTIRGRNTGIYGDFHVSFLPATPDGVAIKISDPWIETDLDIRELSAAVASENFARGLATQFSGADGDSFVIDLGEAKTVGSAVIIWGTESGGASADSESRHAEKFKLERSLDGVMWTNFDAHPGGEVQTPWFGIRTAEPSVGTEEFDGHAVSDSIQGGTALPVIDMGDWGPGHPVPFPVFSPDTARYIRFTALCGRELGGKKRPTLIRELRVYAESPSEVEQSMTREYALDASRADLIFRAGISCHAPGSAAGISNSDPITAVIEGVITPGELRFTREITLRPGEETDIEIDGITLDNPTLWYPNTYGEPFLYTARVAVRTPAGAADEACFKFGVRKFTYPIDGGLLTLYCNGVRIVAKGGNWGMDDGLKLDTPEVFDHKVRLHAEANMTMIRNWIGMTNHPAFYDACDKYGILIWDDFWLANPVDGPDPNDVPLFLENAADKIKKYRSHAALAIYCGRNEGNPPPEIDEPLRELTAALDGTRVYFPCSAMPPVGSGGGYSLAWQGAERGVKQYFNDVTSTVLRSERGIPNVPELRSLKKFVAPENLWPISEVWALHDWTYHMNGPASSYMGALQDYLGGDFDIPVDNVQGQKPDESDPVFSAYKKAVKKMTAEAGNAWSIGDFSRAAQMINFEHHRGLFEALGARRSNGLLMWMSQSSWQSFMWQTYDWYLDVNGGYFGARAGNQPTRALWDPRGDRLLLANHTPREYRGVTVTAEIFNMRGEAVSKRDYSVETLGADASGVFVAALDFSAADTDVIFLRLRLLDESNAVLGENTYWHNKREYQNYRAMGDIPSITAELTVRRDAERTAKNGALRREITVKNTGSAPAVQLALHAETADGCDILPVFWSDNYFTLMPGERKIITAEIPSAGAMLSESEPVFKAEGWNIAP